MLNASIARCWSVRCPLHKFRYQPLYGFWLLCSPDGVITTGLVCWWGDVPVACRSSLRVAVTGAVSGSRTVVVPDGSVTSGRRGAVRRDRWMMRAVLTVGHTLTPVLLARLIFSPGGRPCSVLMFSRRIAAVRWAQVCGWSGSPCYLLR